MKRVLFYIVMILSMFQYLPAESISETEKIVILINHVRSMNGAVFIRNGSEYTPDQAADHLEMKYKRSGGRIKSARNFIDHIASKSYLSGKDYMIRLSNGKTVKTKIILDEKLKEIEK